MSKKQQPVTGSPAKKYTSLYDALHQLEYEVMDRLVGKLLTLLDATIADERQVKATKDMAKGIIYASAREFADYIKFPLWTCQQTDIPLLPEWLEVERKKELR